MKQKRKRAKRHFPSHPKLHWHSLRLKLICMLAGIAGFTVFSCWFLSMAFLNGYYERSKVDTLGEAYEKSNEFQERYINAELKQNERDLQFEILGANAGIDVYIFDLIQMVDRINISFQYPDIAAVNSIQRNDLKNKVTEYIIGQETTAGEYQNKQLLRSEQEYEIYKVYDERMGSLYMELIGASDSGSYIYIRANYQSMREGIKIFNKFLGYIAMVAMLASVVMMLGFSKNFIRPIMELTDIAQRMSRLDLDVRYQDTQRYDEIGILGNSFNTMAERLEKNISELKQANNQLQHDIEHKTQVDEMRKEFLANVSHELKTPIALIQGYAEGLSENINEDIESRKFYCEVIVDEAVKMNQMVKKILSLNQIESGAEQLEFTRFNVVDVISSVLQSAKILAEQKGARISFEQYHAVYVWADEFLVEEVVTNYISNAIHHVDDDGSGDGIIEVMIKEQEDLVRISVYNSGSHIPEEELDKVWIKFYKVDKARTREYGGSGIGLSIVKAVMDSLNRHYGVRNHQDGVEFWFELEAAERN